MKKSIIFLLAIGIISAMYYVSSNDTPQLMQVGVVSAIKQDIYNSIYASGEIEGTNEQEYATTHTAKVVEIYAKTGDNVLEGQPLIRLQNTQAEISQEDIIDIAKDILQNDDKISMPSSTFEISQDVNSEYTVYAQKAGVVLWAPENIGDILLPTISYLKTANVENLKICVQIPETYASKVENGQYANVTCDALPDAIISAKVETIAPYARRAISITGTESTAKVEATLTMIGQNEQIKPGYSVSVKIFTDNIKDAILIPYEAICQENTNEYVFIIKEGIAVKTYIETGYELDGYIEIKSGVKYGDIVILSPSDDLKDGDVVEALIT